MSKYEKRRNYELKLSERQLEQMSILHAMSIFSENHNLKKIPDVNSKWLEVWRRKRFDLHSEMIEDLKKTGICDSGGLRIRKSKKGYVIEQIYKWRSKGMKSKQVICFFCKKSQLVDWFSICESCEKELKKKRKYQKFLRGEWDGRRKTSK